MHAGKRPWQREDEVESVPADQSMRRKHMVRASMAIVRLLGTNLL